MNIYSLVIKSNDLKKFYYTEDSLKEITSKRLKELYSDNPEKSISERYRYELQSIKENNFIDLYMFLYNLVEKVKEDDETFILRGTIGSSLVAYLLGISYADPIKLNIPFETSSTSKGDRRPNFEFEFSSEYIQTIYKCLQNLFIKNNIEFEYEDSEIDYSTLKINFIENKGLKTIKELEKKTGINHKNIDITDNRLFELFEKDKDNNIDDLIRLNEYQKDIVNKVKPKNVEELIKVSALIHGTNVWEDNIENLIEEYNIEEIACSRDDIYLYLLEKGIDKETAFKIMEFVRKGRASSLKYEKEWIEYSRIMRDNNTPEWYINSLSKIKYMFPKAHCACRVIYILWLVWYKIYYPKEYKEIIDFEEFRKEVEQFAINLKNGSIDKMFKEFDKKIKE